VTHFDVLRFAVRLVSMPRTAQILYRALRRNMGPYGAAKKAFYLAAKMTLSGGYHHKGTE
jgi:hypothetical protein